MGIKTDLSQAQIFMRLCMQTGGMTVLEKSLLRAIHLLEDFDRVNGDPLSCRTEFYLSEVKTIIEFVRDAMIRYLQMSDDDYEKVEVIG